MEDGILQLVARPLLQLYLNYKLDIIEYPHFIDTIAVTDEATFSMNGRVNTQNTTRPLILQMEIFLKEVFVEIKSLFRQDSLATEQSWDHCSMKGLKTFDALKEDSGKV